MNEKILVPGLKYIFKHTFDYGIKKPNETIFAEVKILELHGFTCRVEMLEDVINDLLTHRSFNCIRYKKNEIEVSTKNIIGSSEDSELVLNSSGYKISPIIKNILNSNNIFELNESTAEIKLKIIESIIIKNGGDENESINEIKKIIESKREELIGMMPF